MERRAFLRAAGLCSMVVIAGCTASTGGADDPESAAEIMVDGDRAHLVRERETVEQQLALEHTLPE